MAATCAIKAFSKGNLASTCISKYGSVFDCSGDLALFGNVDIAWVASGGRATCQPATPPWPPTSTVFAL
eukprot:4959591-Amphidinium_carterae.1